MAQQTIAGHVRDGVNLQPLQCLDRTLIQCGHGLNCGKYAFFRCRFFFYGRGNDAGTKGFCKYKNISRLRPGIGPHIFFIHFSGNHQPVFRFLIIDGMPAHDGDSGFSGFVCTALQYFSQDRFGQIVDGKTYYI